MSGSRRPFVHHVLRIASDYNWTFVFVMVLTLVSCAFSIHYLSTLEADLKDVYENDVRGADSIQLASTTLAAIESAAKDQLIDDEPRAVARSRAEVRGLVNRLKGSVNGADSRFYTPKARQAYLTAKDHLASYLDAVDGFSSRPPARDSLAQVQAATDVLQKDFDLLIANRIANSRKGIADLFFELRFSLAVTVGILFVSIAVRILLYYAGHPRRKKTPPSHP